MKYLMFALLLVAIVACAQAPVPTAVPTGPSTSVPPTIDPHAVETRVAANIYATQTASAPTVTSTPVNTPTRAATRTPMPTDTPRPTNTPVPTVVIPSGWKTYKDITGQFSFAYPNNFVVKDQGREELT